MYRKTQKNSQESKIKKKKSDFQDNKARKYHYTIRIHWKTQKKLSHKHERKNNSMNILKKSLQQSNVNFTACKQYDTEFKTYGKYLGTSQS